MTVGTTYPAPRWRNRWAWGPALGVLSLIVLPYLWPQLEENAPIVPRGGTSVVNIKWRIPALGLVLREGIDVSRFTLSAPVEIASFPGGTDGVIAEITLQEVTHAKSEHFLVYIIKYNDREVIQECSYGRIIRRKDLTFNDLPPYPIGRVEKRDGRLLFIPPNNTITRAAGGDSDVH
jgi:hypothetical protein